MSGNSPAGSRTVPVTAPSVQLTRDGLYVMGRPRELMAVLRDLSRSYDRLADLLKRTTH